MTRECIALWGGTPTMAREAHRRWPDITAETRQAVERVLDRAILSGANAPEAVAFEGEFARFVGAKHALLTHSGTSALHLALAAAGVGPGDHVVVPAYSFVATALAVLHAGAIPIFADVDPETGLLEASAASAALTSRTRAIMPVHVHGMPVDLHALIDLANRRGLLVIEDAAQAHGASYGGRLVGTIANAGAFSLQSSKNLSAGEGGVFVTNDGALAERANRLRNFGQDVTLGDRDLYDSTRPLDAGRSLESRGVGWMYRGNELQAAFARAQLAGLPARTASCQRNAERLARALANLPGVSPPAVLANRSSVHHKFRVRLDTGAAGVDLSPRALRDATMSALRAEGLEVVLWQTAPLPAQSLFVHREGLGGGFPWSLDGETDFTKLYDVARFPDTQRLLDGSIVLFSQSCPLIAQSDEIVDRYADAFRRVWEVRHELARWAERGTIPDNASRKVRPVVSGEL
jgi:dTDP-4-amino-4,6-dideoxygalactose transaminase